MFLLSQLEIKNHNDLSDKDSDKRLSVKNALPIAIHCINVNCSSCCCCLQWERLNGTEERKQWFQEEDRRPDRRMAWKRESQEFIPSPLDLGKQRAAFLVSGSVGSSETPRV